MTSSAATGPASLLTASVQTPRHHHPNGEHKEADEANDIEKHNDGNHDYTDNDEEDVEDALVSPCYSPRRYTFVTDTVFSVSHMESLEIAARVFARRLRFTGIKDVKEALTEQIHLLGQHRRVLYVERTGKSTAALEYSRV